MNKFEPGFIEFAIEDFGNRLRNEGIPTERASELVSLYEKGLRGENVASEENFTAYLYAFREKHNIRRQIEKNAEIVGKTHNSRRGGRREGD